MDISGKFIHAYQNDVINFLTFCLFSVLKCIINPFVLPCHFILIYILRYEERRVVKLRFFFFSLNIYSAGKR